MASNIFWFLSQGPARPKVTTAEEKGYTTGVILPSAGFLDVTVSEDTATVKYFKTSSEGGYTIEDSVVLQ